MKKNIHIRLLKIGYIGTFDFPLLFNSTATAIMTMQEKFLFYALCLLFFFIISCQIRRRYLVTMKTGGGGGKRMRKGLVLLIIISLMTIPVVSAIPQPQSIVKDTTIVRCLVDGKRIEKEMSFSAMQDLIDMGALLKEDFLTIYDKTKSTEEVTAAFENIKPFFQALIDNGLTDKTVDELNTLYNSIRERIREPRHTPIWKPQDNPSDPRPLGIWNGVPTPVWGNVLCGMFDVGLCAGFVFGTHTLIPTVGADAFLTYTFQGTSLSLGLSGGSMAALAFNVIFGFVGILLAIPLIMFGPYFLTGLAGAYLGVGF